MNLTKHIQIPFKLLRLTYCLMSKYPKDIPFYFEWIASLKNNKNGRTAFVNQKPWLTFRATKWLDSYLKSYMRVFEYGSGGSTLFFAQRVKEVVSVEHNLDWFNSVRKTLRQMEISNVEYFLKEPEKLDQKQKTDYTDPHCYASGFQNEFDRMSFHDYVKVIDNYPDYYFDLVLIDGRARPSCIMHAIKKVKKGGIIVLDNSDRVRYDVASTKYLANSKCVRFLGIGPYSTEPWETVIFLA